MVMWCIQLSAAALIQPITMMGKSEKRRGLRYSTAFWASFLSISIPWSALIMDGFKNLSANITGIMIPFLATGLHNYAAYCISHDKSEKKWIEFLMPQGLEPRHIFCDGVIQPHPSNIMLHWTLVFLVIALIAAVLGFGSLAGTAAAVAKVLFLIFLVVWLLSFFTRR